MPNTKLSLIDLKFEHFNFKRLGKDETESIEFEPKFILKQNKDSKDIYMISIKAICQQKNNFSIEIELTGIFKVEFQNKEEFEILVNNAVAIMMPYIRSEISLITSQPGMKPIIIPVINLSK